MWPQGHRRKYHVPVGPLAHITEVMVNGPDDVFVEREGRLDRVQDRLFEGEGPVLHLIERIVGPLGLRVDGSSPWVDARLLDGSRVHAIVPPLSLRVVGDGRERDPGCRCKPRAAPFASVSRHLPARHPPASRSDVPRRQAPTAG